ncbi:DNA phosphorothioation-dependent restriction protein DptG [Oceanisphaera sp. KMM 10153]|uniref:DNA phosphorothioation-dependent restriction protein DptG n=1 Tax=Oceanisphaera submarina TaxID=3390193 RepID=UPI0039755B16
MYQYPISEGLAPTDKNKLSNYWPIRNKGNDFDWDTVTGVVLSLALRRQVTGYEFEQYREDCRERFLNKLDEPDFWSVVNRAYFASEALFDISPLFLLFKAKGRQSGKVDVSASDLRLCKLFAGLLGNYFLENALDDRLNFIEQEMLTVLQSRLQQGTAVQNNEQPYLPFLNKVFREDIAFLAEHPQYLLQALPKMLKLYAFAYCAQLALNVTDWRDAEVPQSKPLYFILDSEKASSERTSVKRSGYKLLASACERVFPMLSALDALQIPDSAPRPLWQVYQEAKRYYDQPRLLGELNSYLQAFIEKRKLQPRAQAEDIESAFEQLKELALEQFRDAKTTRGGVNKKYMKELEEQLLRDFVQARGAAGRTLVLNQDQILLLTNLTIGKAEKLRLHELREGFEQRGFYLDNQSLQMLVSFYERMGNVERMSDSGDAVYVRKTL